jgi:hypothetical protein
MASQANVGRQGAAILVRVMGIILALLAVEIVLTTLGMARLHARVAVFRFCFPKLPAPLTSDLRPLTADR